MARRRGKRTKSSMRRAAASKMRRGKLDETKLLIMAWWLAYRLWRWAFPIKRDLGDVILLARHADKFYSSQDWKALRFATLIKNKKAHRGVITCEICEATASAGGWHCDHINPRSTHPEQALDPENVRILCVDCNEGRSNKYQEGDEPNERKAAA